MPLDGEVIKETFYLTRAVNKAPVLDLPATRLKQCCGACVYNVLASSESSDSFKNDINTIDWFFPQIYDSADLKLFKYNKVIGDFEEIELLSDDTFGTLFLYGIIKDNQLPQNNYVGYQIEWKKVLEAHGEGSYKIRVEYTSLLGDGFIDSDEYCLHEYSPFRANRTVKIEYNINGLLGDNQNDYSRRDYGITNRYNSLRLKGMFSYVKSGYEQDYTLYNNGARPWIKSEQEPEFTLELHPICWNFHELLRTDVLQADKILITDYNSNNFAKWVQKEVQSTSEYAPNFFVNQSMLAGVTELKFRQGPNNLKKRRY